MRTTTFAAVASLLPASAIAFSVNGRSSSQFEAARSFSQPQKRELVNSTTLQETIKLENLLAHAEALEGFAYSYPTKNRLIGSGGHNDTVTYVKDELEKLGGYYNVSLQPFTATFYIPGTHNLTVNGTETDHAGMNFSPNGDVDDKFVAVANVGCDATDFPADVSGHIALISRGTCNFAVKVTNAYNAGALAAVIYNNQAGVIAGRLDGGSTEYVPTVAITQDLGLSYMEQLSAGNDVTARVVVADSVTTTTITNNVIAQTVGGDQENVIHLGAHSDSVAAGPGINDNGSGSIALLEIAKQLSQFEVNNAVRFSWWSAEEHGLQGAAYYVSQLTPEENLKIRLYLNFDMIASPNYVLAAYDGDGSVFGTAGPTGSAEAEALFHAHYESVGSPFTSSPFNGRSDYGPFLTAGIPSGGLDTGAEGIKTEEEAAIFGGEAGVAYDINYHQAGDKVDNLAQPALEINSKAIAHAVSAYATSFEGFPARTAPEAAAQRVSSQPRIFGGDRDLA